MPVDSFESSAPTILLVDGDNSYVLADARGWWTPESRLAPVIVCQDDLATSNQVVVLYPVTQDLGESECGSASACDRWRQDGVDVVPGVREFEAEIGRVLVVDYLQSTAGLAGHAIGCVLREHSIVLGVDTAHGQQGIKVLPGGTAGLHTLERLMPAEYLPRGAASVSLDGTLSALTRSARTVVGVSTTTSIAVIVSSAIFDLAATIFAEVGDQDCGIVGWGPEVIAVAEDLASLRGRSVTLLHPLAPVARYLQEHDGLTPRTLRIDVEPQGSERLLRRLYRDWCGLRERIGGDIGVTSNRP